MSTLTRLTEEKREILSRLQQLALQGQLRWIYSGVRKLLVVAQGPVILDDDLLLSVLDFLGQRPVYLSPHQYLPKVLPRVPLTEVEIDYLFGYQRKGLRVQAGEYVYCWNLAAHETPEAD